MYCLIEFDRERNEVSRSFPDKYPELPIKLKNPNGYGVQIQKKHRAGYWFPIDEFYK